MVRKSLLLVIMLALVLALAMTKPVMAESLAPTANVPFMGVRHVENQGSGEVDAVIKITDLNGNFIVGTPADSGTIIVFPCKYAGYGVLPIYPLAQLVHLVGDQSKVRVDYSLNAHQFGDMSADSVTGEWAYKVNLTDYDTPGIWPLVIHAQIEAGNEKDLLRVLPFFPEWQLTKGKDKQLVLTAKYWLFFGRYDGDGSVDDVNDWEDATSDDYHQTGRFHGAFDVRKRVHAGTGSTSSTTVTVPSGTVAAPAVTTPAPTPVTTPTPAPTPAPAEATVQGTTGPLHVVFNKERVDPKHPEYGHRFLEIYSDLPGTKYTVHFFKTKKWNEGVASGVLSTDKNDPNYLFGAFLLKVWVPGASQPRVFTFFREVTSTKGE